MNRIHLYVPLKRGQLYIGTVKSVLRNKVVFSDGEDIEEPYGRVLTIRLPLSMKDISRQQLDEAFRHSFRQHCHHDFDCCGCYFGGVRKIQHNTKRDITITTHYSRNY